MDEATFLKRTALQEAEYSQIQALTVTSLSHHPFSAFFLLHFGATGGHRWLEELSRRITPVRPKSDGESRRTEPVRNVALTLEGLTALGLSAEELQTFPFPFQEGMTSPHRRRILGDAGEAVPEKWQWGGGNGPSFHALLMLYSSTCDGLDRLVAEETSHWAAAGLSLAWIIPAASRTPSSHEHFGFADGVGQPVIRGTPNAGKQTDRTGHETLVNAGEFVLGYINEDKVPPPSPSVDCSRDRDGLLPPTRHLQTGTYQEDGQRRDLGANGTFLVFRQLEQDVPRFWKNLDQLAGGDPQRRELLAAKVVGRWPSGAPLVCHPGVTSDPSPGKDELTNDFGYRQNDPDGLSCPIGAHMRRANPRDSLGDDAETALASARRHRLLRRGRSYGPGITDRFQDDATPRGLHFLCLNADLERQFEFVQQTWLNSSIFDGLNGEIDPLIGMNDPASSALTIPGTPVAERVCGLARYVTVRGGAYFFLPSLPALRFLSKLTPE